ncbi:MAG: GreA/GreB family elongation factor, partial [Actinomycetota bacterium]
ARVRQLRAMIDRAEIIQSDDDETVKPGKVVTILHDGDDEPETYLIGLREEKGASHDVLTPDSPVGKALVGRSPGETVVAHVPAGELRLEIVEIAAP